MNGNEQPNDYKQTQKLTTIDPSALYALICDDVDINWKVIESKLTSSDEEDGGGHYCMVLKHLPTGRFYETTYCDWDVDNTQGDRCDLNCRLVEVAPQQVTITSYKYI